MASVEAPRTTAPGMSASGAIAAPDRVAGRAILADVAVVTVTTLPEADRRRFATILRDIGMLA